MFDRAQKFTRIATHTYLQHVAEKTKTQLEQKWKPVTDLAQEIERIKRVMRKQEEAAYAYKTASLHEDDEQTLKKANDTVLVSELNIDKDIEGEDGQKYNLKVKKAQTEADNTKEQPKEQAQKTQDNKKMKSFGKNVARTGAKCAGLVFGAGAFMYRAIPFSENILHPPTPMMR